MDKTEEKEELEQWITDVVESSKLIIVEGKKDLGALRGLEITNEVVMLNKPLFEVCEEVSLRTDEVILLTDFDKKGKELYHKLKVQLERLGVKIDNTFREKLQRTSKLSHIEGILTYILNLNN